LGSTASATVVIPRTFRELCVRADLIFMGTVIDVSPLRSSPQVSISTLVAFSDLEIVKGAYHQGTLTLRLAGGETDSLSEVIPGMPTFQVGDREIIFMYTAGLYANPIVGFHQGRFRVLPIGPGGREVVCDHGGLPIYGVQEGKLVRGRTPRVLEPGQEGMSPQRFIDAIARELALLE
jgi:hypothetical protein